MEEKVLDQPESTTETDELSDDNFDLFEEMVTDTETEESQVEDTNALEQLKETETEETEKTEEVSTPTETKEETVDGFELDVVYNKETKKLSKEEAKEFAQKGLNYDKLNEKYESLKASKELTYLEQKAKENGFDTTEKFVEALEESERKLTAKQEEEELNKMIDGGVDVEMAKKIIETNKIAKELEFEKAKIKAKEAEVLKKEQEDNARREFIKAFPDVKAEEIPKEVFIQAESVGLKAAYTEYALDKAKKEIELLKTNNENLEKSPVKGVTTHGGVNLEVTDPFLEGFDS